MKVNKIYCSNKYFDVQSTNEPMIPNKQLYGLFLQEKDWPLKSNLDPSIYGPAESALTKELVENEIKGFMTVEQVR